ncbi:MAG: hypothetical protein QME51_04630 [Planctomycetota bacterium]|nr:hypothetical protein [Planctomycetota bacterium]MDI6787636.1 hypothetical protein [Planctomycetota bacterium]
MPEGDILVSECISCSAKYNVAKLKPGTKFRCRRCNAVNVVITPEQRTVFLDSSFDLSENGKGGAGEKTASADTTPKPPTAPTQTPTPKPPLPQTPAVRPPSPAPRPAAPTSRPLAPAPRPAVPASRPPVTTTPTRGIPPKIAPLKKGLPTTGRLARQPAGVSAEEDEMAGIQVKKSKAWLIIVIIIGLAILGGGYYFFVASKGPSVEEEEAIKRAEKESAEKKKEKEKLAPPPAVSEEEVITPEEIAPVEETPKEVKKLPKPKIDADIDPEVEKEIMPILQEMEKQKEAEQQPGIEKIKGFGKKAIPVLIKAISDDNDQVGRYAYEILLKITGRNKDDTTVVTPMIGKEGRKDARKEWEKWWFENKDTIPDSEPITE